MVIKTNYLNYLFNGGFSLASEIKIKNNKSINISYENGNLRDGIAGRNYDKFSTTVLEWRKYFMPSKSTPSGIFVGTYLKHRYRDKLQYESNGLFGWGAVDEDIYKAHSLGSGILGGYQNHIFKRQNGGVE